MYLSSLSQIKLLKLLSTFFISVDENNPIHIAVNYVNTCNQIFSIGNLPINKIIKLIQFKMSNYIIVKLKRTS